MSFCVGCNQNTDCKDAVTRDTPISKTAIPTSSGYSNSSEEIDMKITMVIAQNTYPSTIDKVNVIITNNSADDWNTDMDYCIKYFDGSAWSKIPLSFAVDDVKIIIHPQKSKKISIYLYPEQHNYKLGKYRVSKIVSSSNATNVLTAEFNIQ